MKKLLRLDLGAGQSPKPGFKGVDLCKLNGNRVHDLTRFPWPFRKESVEEIHCSHFLEHVPGLLRFRFMDEVYRILIPEGKATFIVPYWASSRAVQDPTHQWPPLAEQSFLYFNKKWRDDNKLNHYPVKCDFDFTYGYLPDPETASRAQDAQAFWIKHYLHAISDLQVVMIKR